MYNRRILISLYTFLTSGAAKALPDLYVLCMARTCSQNDTHDFVKSCVSFFEIDMSIHKSADLRFVLRAGEDKNVYVTQRTDEPYTARLVSAAQQTRSLCSMGLTSAAQQAPRLYKTRLFCPGSSEESERECIEDIWRMHGECTDGVMPAFGR